MENYQNYIVSTEELNTFLHRTSKTLVDKILKEGLTTNGNIKTTATLQPKNLEVAINYYLNGKDHGGACVVIQIPKKTWDSARSCGYRDDEVMSPAIGFLDMKNHGFTVKPEYVVGWIDRETNTFYKKQ
jgi:hypothetical protein